MTECVIPVRELRVLSECRQMLLQAPGWDRKVDLPDVCFVAWVHSLYHSEQQAVKAGKILRAFRPLSCHAHLGFNLKRLRTDATRVLHACNPLAVADGDSHRGLHFSGVRAERMNT